MGCLVYCAGRTQVYFILSGFVQNVFLAVHWAFISTLIGKLQVQNDPNLTFPTFNKYLQTNLGHISTLTGIYKKKSVILFSPYF